MHLKYTHKYNLFKVWEGERDKRIQCALTRNLVSVGFKGMVVSSRGLSPGFRFGTGLSRWVSSGRRVILIN